MKKIILQPVEMTTAIMQDLEARKLIIRLCPNHHELRVARGECNVAAIYEGQPAYGPHKLISVTVDRAALTAFGSHPDNEEFLLIGDPSTKPLYLAIGLAAKDELARKIAQGCLSASDFVCLRVTYNDPNVSFFTMLAHVPHGEAVADCEGRAASFYVTEPCNMGLERTDFRGYELRLPPAGGH